MKLVLLLMLIMDTYEINKYAIVSEINVHFFPLIKVYENYFSVNMGLYGSLL